MLVNIVLATMGFWGVFGIGVVCIILGFAFGYIFVNYKTKKAGRNADKIIEDAKNVAEENRRNSVVETKQELFKLKLEADKEIKNRKKEVSDSEQKLVQREERLDNRSSNLDKREESLNVKELKIDQRKSELDKQYAKVDALIEEQNTKLIEISGLKPEDAKSIILERIEEEMSQEIAVVIKENEEKAKLESAKKAQVLLANAIQQYANEAISEKCQKIIYRKSCI